MALTRKRGKLSNEEMNYIRQNCFDLPLEEIANNLNRTVTPVKKFIDKENLKARDLTDDEHLLSTLRTKYYFHELKRQFSDAEIIFFEHNWIDFYKQFNEDVTHTEEMQILEVIRTEILINRSMEDRQQIMEQIDVMTNLIDVEMDKPEELQDVGAIAMFQTQLGALIGSKSSYINEHEKLIYNTQDRSMKKFRRSFYELYNSYQAPPAPEPRRQSSGIKEMMSQLSRIKDETESMISLCD